MSMRSFMTTNVYSFSGTILITGACLPEVDSGALEPLIQEALEMYGKRGADEMASLLSQNEALFAGGTLTEDQKDMFFEAIARAYFMNKERARDKFGKKKSAAARKETREPAQKTKTSPAQKAAVAKMTFRKRKKQTLYNGNDQSVYRIR